ncbi:hypothetical protein NBT05_04685 [Aquimarina sp. ERC-38]|uniref:hypothetical protein n=1 Tax=Aquimarina sp. ERC-38 TaxID=2949996 RepID=UPI002247EDBE|nr:hypothetical protein [Aquimarina sp. ERC-38]UZO81767.1 hypothetical protein NBT05_04685 [Aquimarina sp. ERC-38]
MIDVKINHDYFLDDGTTKFDDLLEDQKNVRLANYNISDNLTITPVLKTQSDLRNHKIVFRQTNRGFLLFANVDEYTRANDSAQVFCSKIQPTKDLMLTFKLRFKDTYFRNYTNNTDSEENRFFYFSNVRPDGENNSLSIFFKNTKVHTRFLLQPETSRSIMHEILINEIAPIDPLGLENIVLINPEDINEPQNVELLNEYIETQKLDGLIGYFRFAIDGRGNNDILVDTTVEIANGPNETLLGLPDEVPGPTLRFENRKTFWRYIDINEDEAFTTKQEQPLTQNGFVELRPNDLDPRLKDVFLLNPGKENIRIEEDNMYSEIFI